MDNDTKPGTLWDYNLHYPDFTWPPKQHGFDQNSLFGIDPLLDAGLIAPLLGSPVLDAGLAVADFNYDRACALRPQGPAWDIGAWEGSPVIFIDGFESGGTGAWSES